MNIKELFEEFQDVTLRFVRFEKGEFQFFATGWRQGVSFKIEAIVAADNYGEYPTVEAEQVLYDYEWQYSFGFFSSVTFTVGDVVTEWDVDDSYYNFTTAIFRDLIS